MTSLCEAQVPLSLYTTLEVGGQAHRLAVVDTRAEALAEAERARRDGLPLLVIGGGSNLLVSDQGYPGLVLRWNDTSLEVIEEDSDQVRVKVGGGWVWDEWVAYAVAQNWVGVECLSGIPGRVGAAPIQNIGAYGQEVAQALEACWVLDWSSGQELRLEAAACGFGYRMSRFKGEWRGRYLVTAVEFRLARGGAPRLLYRELQSQMQGLPLTAAEVRRVVLQIRRSKSMVWDPADPNHRSAGSFFLNPVVSAEQAEQVRAHSSAPMPSWPAEPGRVKLSAAWLIEQSGFHKGWGQGPAGLSSNHVLALINRGGASARDIVAVAGAVRRGVQAHFGVSLHPEPEFVGFSESVEELLRV